jgi:hypothetical protein
LLDVLGHDRLASVSPEPDAEDWYANLVWIEQRKCLLLTHSGTLSSVFSPNVSAGALRATGTLFAQLVATALADEGLPGGCFGDLAYDELTIAKTGDRQILGCMNDFSSICEHTAINTGGLTRLDAAQLNRTLHRIIHRARGYEPPIDAVRERLGSD